MNLIRNMFSKITLLELIPRLWGATALKVQAVRTVLCSNKTVYMEDSKLTFAKIVLLGCYIYKYYVVLGVQYCFKFRFDLVFK